MREWVFLGAIVAALLVFQGLRRAFWIFSIMVLPGTFAHEACHYLTGLLLRGGPGRFNLLPRREGQGWVMGCVTFNHLRWWNCFFIAMAPLSLLPAAWFLVRWRLQGGPVFGWREALAVYLIANLIYAALPSWQDVKVGAKSPFGWLILAGGAAWAWHVLQVGAR